MYYYPQSKIELKPWAENLAEQIATIGPRINEPAADIAKVQADMQQLITDINNWEAAHKELQRLTAILAQSSKTIGEATRDYIRRLRTNPLITEADAKALKIVSTTDITDVTGYQPKLTVKQTGGNMHLSFKKHGADGMNVYTRIHGEANWTLLGNAKKSPFIDTRPLATPNTPEFRDYCIMPTLSNTEVGVRSEVITIRFTG